LENINARKDFIEEVMEKYLMSYDVNSSMGFRMANYKLPF